MKLKSKSSALVAVLFLAACGGAGGQIAGIGSFGAGFVSMFRAAPNAEPLDAQSVNMVAVSFTTDPFNP